MPGKHVRFHGIPQTPSPLYSYTTSLPSEGGPITPPPLNHFGSPHARSPLPSVASRINPALSAASIPLIHYDLTFQPSSLQLHPSLPPEVLDQPATHPPLPCMTIICQRLPWPINVTASNSKLGTYVSVSDVFEALYRTLRLNISGDEFNAIRSAEEQRSIDTAFRRRYGSLVMDRKSYELEKSKGVKRIDYLQETHLFGGLRSTLRGPEVWELCVS